jgi:hypothetical protein
LTTGWTNVDQIVTTLRKRWDRGQYALAYTREAAWEPVSVPVRAPTPADLLDRFDEARRWAEKFEANSRTKSGQPRFRTEYRTVKGRNVGANQLPARIWVDTLEQMCTLLGTTEQLRALDELLTLTRDALPAAVPWVVNHPLVAVEHREIWDRALATVAWITVHDTERLYVRQIDVAGVDTKFVEVHQKLLDQLLSAVLPPERIDPLVSRADFTRRFRFRAKPEHVRVRLLGSDSSLPPGITEARLRADEFNAAGFGATIVFVVENEVSYLAFPDVPDAIATWGSGYGLEPGNAEVWLRNKQIVYWGDIDTHGFAILSSLRARFADVESILMDRDTLLAHKCQWVSEPAPTGRRLDHLTDAEAALYQDLVEDRYGRAVRLEQERVRFSRLRRALQPWTSPCSEDDAT